MSVDLQSRIREYASWVERRQEPVTLEEIMRRPDDTIPLARPSELSGRTLRGPWPALVAAAVVLVIFGVFMWVFPSDQPVPPADSMPPPWEQTGQGYYTTNSVPDGFGLQSMGAHGRLVYVRDFQGAWLPTDGGFAIENPYGGALGGLPESSAEHLDLIIESVPGSMAVTVGGRPGAMFVTELRQGGLNAPLIWVLGFDDEGGVFEVSAVGMTPEEVLGVASGVHRVDVGEFLELGSQIDWDVRSSEVIVDDFRFEPPQEVVELAVSLDVAIGLDLLWSRLAHAGQGGATVVTSDSGEAVEDGEPIRAMTAEMLLEIEDGTEAEVLAARPESELSPELHDAWIDRYVEALRGGGVLSDDPYVIRAGEVAAPRFDVDLLGREVALAPVDSRDELPEMEELSSGGQLVAATEDRPVVVLGSVDRSEMDQPPVSLMVWFTRTDEVCVGEFYGDGVASGCGFLPLVHFGVTGESSVQGDDGFVYGEVTYSVPLETAVVQALTGSETFWQRPIGGYGLFPYGGSVPKAATIIAYDADGNEIGRWPA